MRAGVSHAAGCNSVVGWESRHPWSSGARGGRENIEVGLLGTPATFLVVLALLVTGVAGLFMIFYAAMRSRDDRGGRRICPRCSEANPGHARFCAHCGQGLSTD